MQAADQREQAEQGVADDGPLFAKKTERAVHRVRVADVGRCQQDQEQRGEDEHLGIITSRATFHSTVVRPAERAGHARL